MFSALLLTLTLNGGFSDVQDKTTIKKPDSVPGKSAPAVDVKPAKSSMPASGRRFAFRAGNALRGNVNGVRSRSGVFNRRNSAAGGESGFRKLRGGRRGIGRTGIFGGRR